MSRDGLSLRYLFGKKQSARFSSLGDEPRKVIGADHTNWRVRDLERPLRFYRDVLGLEPFVLEDFHRKERPIVSLRA